MNCNAWVTRNIGIMTKSILHRSLRSCDMELVRSAHELPLNMTRQFLAEASANLSIRDFQVHSFEVLPVADGILLAGDVHLQDLALRRRDTSAIGWLIDALRHI